MPAYKLAIGQVVEFTSVMAYTDGGQACEAKVLLQAQRIDEPELRAFRSAQSQTVADVLVSKMVGWEQPLVLDEAGRPAAFSPEALRCLLSLPGAANVVFADYVRACSVEAKRGN